MKRLASWVISAAVLFVPVVAIAGEEPDARANQFPLRFKDANGKVLGRVLWSGGIEDSPFAVMQEGKHVFAAELRAGNGPVFDLLSPYPVYYETTDCSGLAYIEAYYMPRGLRTGRVVSYADGKTLVMVGSGIRIPITAKSSRLPDLPCEADDRSILAVESVTDTVDITGKYRAPFSIR